MYTEISLFAYFSLSLSLHSDDNDGKRMNQHRSPTVDSIDRTISQSERDSCVCHLLDENFSSSEFYEPLNYPLGEFLGSCSYSDRIEKKKGSIIKCKIRGLQLKSNAISNIYVGFPENKTLNNKWEIS